MLESCSQWRSVLVHYPGEVGAISVKSLHLVSCNTDSMLLRRNFYLTTRGKVCHWKKMHIPIYLHITLFSRLKFV